MNYMDRGETISNAEAWHRSFNVCDYVLSSSNLYEVLMSSCIGIPKEKFIRTGFPRNDMLFTADNKSREIVSNYFGNDIFNDETKIIFYLPTFRIGHKGNKIEGKLREGNIFGFEDVDYNKIDKWLRDNNYVLLSKLHPMEENLVSGKSINVGERMKLIDSRWLTNIDKDLYKLLSISDMLITDYSSVYFDYLLLDKPLIFIQNDLEEYRRSRGILLEPYESWTPGYKVSTCTEFIKALNEYSNDERLYSKERKQLKDLVFEVSDPSNCMRVWNDIIQPIIK